MRTHVTQTGSRQAQTAGVRAVATRASTKSAAAYRSHPASPASSARCRTLATRMLSRGRTGHRNGSEARPWTGAWLVRDQGGRAVCLLRRATPVGRAVRGKCGIKTRSGGRGPSRAEEQFHHRRQTLPPETRRSPRSLSRVRGRVVCMRRAWCCWRGSRCAEERRASGPEAAYPIACSPIAPS